MLITHCYNLFWIFSNSKKIYNFVISILRHIISLENQNNFLKLTSNKNDQYLNIEKETIQF